jgi:hypothetical protein
MRRQALVDDIRTGGGTRPDPFHLPARYSTAMADGAPAAVHLERDRIVVERRGSRPLTLTLPIRFYRGVAVRMTAEGEALRVAVELHHDDPALSVTLAVGDDPADIAADWQAWGRILGLPLLLVAPDGSVEMPADNLGALEIAAAKPRRHHSFFADRRPRFLTRRKVGRDRGERIAGREIIARD